MSEHKLKAQQPFRAGPMGKVMYVNHPALPEIQFEFHPYSRKVFFYYITALGTAKDTMARVAVEGVQDQREAKMAIAAFIMGYREHKLKVSASAGGQ